MTFLSVLLICGQFSGLSLSGPDRVLDTPSPVVAKPSQVLSEPFPPLPPAERARITIEPTEAKPVPLPPAPKPSPVPKPVPRVAVRPVPASAKSPPPPAFELTWWPMRDYPGWEMHGRNAYGVIVDVDQFRWVGIPQAVQPQPVQSTINIYGQPAVPMYSSPAMPAYSQGLFGGRFRFMGSSCAGGSCR